MMARALLRLCLLLGLLVGVSLLGGCLAVGRGTQEPTRFYVLSPLPAAQGVVVPGPSLGVGPVSLPAYLDRPHIVTRTGTNELLLADFARWGEPLSDLVPRTLSESLSALLGAERVRAFPWSTAEAVDCQVVVDVLRFDADEGGAAVLEADWALLGSGRRELSRGRSTRREPVETVGHGAVVAAESRALQGLAREIAAAARVCPGPRPEHDEKPPAAPRGEAAGGLRGPGSRTNGR